MTPSRPFTGLAACAVALSACHAPARPERWAGTVTPAAESKVCQRTRGIASITGRAVLFAPNEGTWILNGLIAPDGTITADRATQGANPPYETTLTARRSETAITGTYKTPQCTFTVNLARV